MRYGISNVLLFLIIVISSCSTPYQPKGILGGFSEEKIEDGIYKVKFDGNQHTKKEKVQKYLLYRCSEITLANDHKYFQIVDETYLKNENSVRPEARVQGKSVSDGAGGKKFVVVPNFSYSTKSSSNTNEFIIKMIDKITMENYQSTFDAQKLKEKLYNDIHN